MWLTVIPWNSQKGVSFLGKYLYLYINDKKNNYE